MKKIKPRKADNASPANQSIPISFPILFCSIAYQKQYQGQVGRDDPPENGGKDSHPRGEVCNFLPSNGKVYGYVERPNKKGTETPTQIRIENLGAAKLPKSRLPDSVPGVTVFWIATPRKGKRCIVGWYKNAIVHRYCVEVPMDARTDQHQKDNLTWYRVEANCSDAYLLPVAKRSSYEVPIGKGWPSKQSQLWYPQKKMDDFDEVKPYLEKLQAELLNSNAGFPVCARAQTSEVSTDESDKTRSAGGGSGWPPNSDPVHNSEVEWKAMQAAMSFYGTQDPTVKDVCCQNLGWDIEGDNLIVEVKGLSGKSPRVELTSNETQMLQNWRSGSIKEEKEYHLCVVTRAIDDANRRLFDCKATDMANKWVIKEFERGATAWCECPCKLNADERAVMTSSIYLAPPPLNFGSMPSKP